MEYRFVGRHAETLGDGRTVGPGDTVGDVDPNDPINQRLIEAGLLVQAGAAAGPRGRRQGSNDEEARA